MTSDLMDHQSKAHAAPQINRKVNSGPVSLDQATVIALRTTQCYAFPPAGFANLSIRQVDKLAIELEQYLPLDAEDLVVATNVQNLKDERRGICIAACRNEIQEAIDEREATGAWIACIAPMATLAVESLLQQKKIPKTCAIAWQQDEGNWDYIELLDGTICKWQWLSHDQLLENLQKIDSELAKPFVAGTGILDDSMSLIQDDKLIAESQDDAVRRLTPSIVRGSYLPQVRFRGKQLVTAQPFLPLHKTLVACSVLLILSLAISGAAMLNYALKLNSEAQLHQIQQEQTFKELFPRQKLPGNIPGRLASERRRLLTEISELHNAPKVKSVLPTAVRLLSAIPPKAQIRIDLVSIREATVRELVGSAATLDDYQAVIDALKSRDFTFAPPSTSQMADGYSMRIQELRTSEKGR